MKGSDPAMKAFEGSVRCLAAGGGDCGGGEDRVERRGNLEDLRVVVPLSGRPLNSP